MYVPPESTGGKPQDEVEIEFPYGKMGTSSFLLLVAMASTLNI